MIWFNLLIPILAILVLVIFFRKKMAWWEYLIVFSVPLITISVCKYTSIIAQTNTNEIWNSYITEARYYEDWDEWVTQTCSRTVSCGKNCTTIEYYDCSHREYHPAYWKIHDNIGNVYGVNQGYYRNLVTFWSNQTFKDMGRHYYTKDGNMYFTKYPNDINRLIPICTRHIYKNKVRSSRSIFNFQKVSQEEIQKYGLYSYPEMPNIFGYTSNYNPILGWNNAQDAYKLQRYNGLLGSWKRVHMLILVYQNKPYEASLMQEALWKGGNKNEFILCIGLNGKKINWTKVISWTDKQDLKVRVVRVVKEMDSLNMSAVIDTVVNEVKYKFVKKDFRDFDYITVEPSDRAVLIAFILTLISTIGLSLFSVLNRFDVDGENYLRPYRK